MTRQVDVESPHSDPDTIGVDTDKINNHISELTRSKDGVEETEATKAKRSELLTMATTMVKSILDFAFGYSFRINVIKSTHISTSKSKKLKPMLLHYDNFKEYLKDGAIPEEFFSHDKPVKSRKAYMAIAEMLKQDNFRKET